MTSPTLIEPTEQPVGERQEPPRQKVMDEVWHVRHPMFRPFVHTSYRYVRQRRRGQRASIRVAVETPSPVWLDDHWLEVRVTGWLSPLRSGGRPAWTCEGLPSPWGCVVDGDLVEWRRPPA